MTFHGSYDPADVTFLLKPADIGFTDVDEKERNIQSGARHYSEMLSVEKVPDERYLALYDEALARNAGRLKADIDRLASMIAAYAYEPVIVSLARAGTPIGVLLGRKLRQMGLEGRHYSVSIIRDRGIDHVALQTIVDRHGKVGLVFVDGWTGKGAITGELKRTLAGTGVRPELAVIADPAGCASMAATTDDYVIPSGILNGIVSGLISRTVLNDDVVGEGDYHACLHQTHLAAHDRSRAFIEAIENSDAEPAGTPWTTATAALAAKAASVCIARMQTLHGITNVNRIKPGIAEATRAVLRRLPEAVHVRDPESPDVRHIVHIARQAGVPFLPLDHDCPYGAITIIKGLGE